MSDIEEIVLGGAPPEGETVSETEILPAVPAGALEVVPGDNPAQGELVSADLMEGEDPDPALDVQTHLMGGEETAAENAPAPVMNQKFTNIRNEERVVTIDRQRSVETEADRQMSDLLDLLESLRSKKIMTGKIEGVENSAGGIPSAVLKHGGFKIIIPCFECVNPPADFRDQEPNSVYQYVLNKHLGAEIEFVVKGIDQESEVVVASRKEAMAIRRRQFYFGQDKDGNNILYEGAIAEARVVSVIRPGIFVEVFGVQCYIPSNELSYQRLLDASAHYQNGMRILVKILKLDRTDPKNVKITVSVKQTKKNPYETVFERYCVGNHYIGTVTMVDINGIFVALDGGIDCLCPFPIRGRPLIGARVTVRLSHISEESHRVRGDIVYSSHVLG